MIGALVVQGADDVKVLRVDGVYSHRLLRAPRNEPLHLHLIRVNVDEAVVRSEDQNPKLGEESLALPCWPRVKDGLVFSHEASPPTQILALDRDALELSRGGSGPRGHLLHHDKLCLVSTLTGQHTLLQEPRLRELYQWLAVHLGVSTRSERRIHGPERLLIIGEALKEGVSLGIGDARAFFRRRLQEPLDKCVGTTGKDYAGKGHGFLAAAVGEDNLKDEPFTRCRKRQVAAEHLEHHDT
mmetsp:Transcript_290/g.938  ORF Transcript_290/g.938 Transcript_290/m.938 type:complete len:241 (-) Transcript_290:849-1571(-)